MPSINIDNLTYNHKSPYRSIFSDYSLNIDCSWKTGLTGKNGSGKTTLLNILSGKLALDSGIVSVPAYAMLFSGEYADTTNTGFDIVKAVCGFTAMEEKMASLLKDNSSESIDQYSDTENLYALCGGYEFESRFMKELSEMGMNEQMGHVRLNRLSGGERTRILITALFIRNDSYALIDEPTNHLDIFGRKKLADYLNRKKGFLLVSHDRYMLDACTDHIISLDKEPSLIKGNYSVWKDAYDKQQGFIERTNENLAREIKHLKKSAADRRDWSDSIEKTIKSAGDRGYVSARSREQMQRALAIEKRIDRIIEQKESLQYERPKKRDLKINTDTGNEILLSVENAGYSINDREIFSDMHFTVSRNSITTIIGRNGCGKTTLFNAVNNEIKTDRGIISIKPGTRISYLKQIPENTVGNIMHMLEKRKTEIRKFTYVMNYLGYAGNILDKQYELLSDGERKKVEIAVSLCSDADLYIWDEPLNYLDIETREKIELLLMEKPAMLICEHDRRFIENISDETIEM